MIFEEFESEENHLILINTFFTEAGQQREVAELLGEMTDRVVRGLPGFVSSRIHLSLDQKFVANYAVWVDEDHFYAMLDHPEIQESLKRVRELCQNITPVLYRPWSRHLPVGGEGPQPFLETWRGPHPPL